MPDASVEVRHVARAIYEANHGDFEALPGGHTAPVWEAASDNVKAFCFRQAEAAIRKLDGIRRSLNLAVHCLAAAETSTDEELGFKTE